MLTVVAPIALPIIRTTVGDVTVTSAISGFATEIVDAGLSSSITYALLMATRTSMAAVVVGSAITNVIEVRNKDFIRNFNLAMGIHFFRRLRMIHSTKTSILTKSLIFLRIVRL